MFDVVLCIVAYFVSHTLSVSFGALITSIGHNRERERERERGERERADFLLLITRSLRVLFRGVSFFFWCKGYAVLLYHDTY